MELQEYQTRKNKINDNRKYNRNDEINLFSYPISEHVRVTYNPIRPY